MTTAPGPKLSAAAADAQTFFKRTFGYTPTHVVQAPGRLELIGNHTDYNNGLVMSLAVDKYITMGASPRADGKIELASSAFPGVAKFSVTNLERDAAAPWTHYVKGVLVELRKHRVAFGGFNAAIHSTIPLGAGLSSSAALEVATALTIRNLHPYTLTETGCTSPPQHDRQGQLPPMTTQEKIAVAKACQRAENQFVGVNCGILDQISCLFGKAFHAIEIDCQSLAVEHVPMLGEIAVVVCNTGVKHELTGGEYNSLRQFCEAAAQALGVKSLRQADPKLLHESQDKLSERQFQCAYHITGEIQRVLYGARALREGDFDQFGQYMFQSHDSSRDYFKNSCAELDLLVDLARTQPECLGARLTGGGFGGATINLVRLDGVNGFISSIARRYQEKLNAAITPMLCQVVDGAH